ncbi:HGxxPAAW family protein [Propionibacteriaceae bacterium G1746]|uniref:HGxxPAAW family protein n=1 Tax=Aestuariimicrobium sp. G57 TaxID=3418485 RepID=UPI003C1DC3D2
MTQSAHADEQFPITTTRDGKKVKYYHHSASPAIWVGTVLVTLGFIVGAIGFVAGPNLLLIYIGAGLIVASFVVTLILKALGLGHG